MARLSARSLWFASLTLVATSACAQASAPAAAGAPQMTQEQAADPAYVVQWLKTHPHAYQQHKTTQLLFEQGRKSEKSRNWSSAMLGYGESMIRYPSPQALAAYARTELLMLGQVRARNGDMATKAKGDVANSLRYYETALAANEVIITLGPDEESTVKRQAQCLRDFVAATQAVSDCEPMKSYLSSGK